MGWRRKESNVRIKIVPSFPAAGGALFSQDNCLTGRSSQGCCRRAGVSSVAEAKAVIMLARLLHVEASGTSDGMSR